MTMDARTLLTAADAVAADARAHFVDSALERMRADHQDDVRSLIEENAALLRRVAELEEALNPPKPASRIRLGAYEPEVFGNAVEVGSTYYQPTERLKAAREYNRAELDIAPNLTWTTKGTDLIARLSRREHSATSWLEDRVGDAVLLAESFSDVDVFLTLESEAKAKVKQGEANPSKGLTGESADPVNIGRAQGLLFQMLAEAGVPNLRSTYWIVGWDRTFEETVAANHGHPFDVFCFDPYANRSDDTLDTITNKDILWAKAQPWYTGQPFALSEFGMPVGFGDDALARFYTDVRGQLRAVEEKHDIEIAFATLFNRSKDNNHRITTGEFPKAVAAFRESLAGPA